MPSQVYFVKQEAGLFRKGTWNIMLGKMVLGMHKGQQEALDAAFAEAERGSQMGRTSEVWLYENSGFVLQKAFLAQKRKGKGGKGDGDDEDPAFLDEDPTFDGAAYNQDATKDNNIL